MMQMTRIAPWALVGALSLWGCAADVGGAGNELRYVDTQDLTGTQLFYAQNISELPLTSAQVATLGDQVHATPVRIEIYNDVAVAWYAPNGVAQIGGRENIVALWSIVDPQPIRDEVAPGSVWTVNNPGLVGGTSSIGVHSSTPNTISTPTLSQLAAHSVAQLALVEFFNRVGSPDEALLIQRLNDAHPGCL